MQPPNDISYFAQTNARNDRRLFGIRQRDRLQHVYVIGQTGVGKSTLLETMARQDIAAGRGFALIDPHGDLVERIAALPALRDHPKVRYLDAPNPAQPFGYNPLHQVREDKISLAVSGILETFKKLWPDAWGVRMEHVLRNSLYALLERDDSMLPDILCLYSDEKYRKRLVRDIRNDTVRHFWQDEFENYPPRLKAEAVAPIQNKLGALLSDPVLYRILVQPEQDLRFRPIMDEGGILLVNLSKGKLGADSAHILGGLIASTLGLAAFSRAESALSRRRPFFLYMDEFQSFTTLMLANMMSELRKYGVGLTLAHQYAAQLEPEIQDAVLGNVGTKIAFRVGAMDAPLLAREFQPQVGVEDLLNLPNHSMYLRLLIEGEPTRPFSATSLAMGDAESSPLNIGVAADAGGDASRGPTAEVQAGGRFNKPGK